VAAPHYLASLAGMDVLRDGGSAVDAALAANMVLAVVWPHMCGPGGDLFAQVWPRGAPAPIGLNASGRAGAKMTVAAYRERGIQSMPARGALSVTVPGAVDGWFQLHQRWGRLEMPRIARDAIRLARDGFLVTPFVSAAIASLADVLRANGDGSDVFLVQGGPPRAGDRLLQPDLATTLDRIAHEGPPAMYAGSLGQRLLAALAQRGSLLEAADFAAHHSEWVDPVAVRYRAAKVWQLPPNTQGIALLQMLLMLEPADLAAWGGGTAEMVHQMVERKKLAFADRDAYVADPACSPVPVDGLLDPAYCAERAAHVDPRAASPAAGAPPASGDTIYLCAADGDGTVVSLIQSLYAGFGSGVHVPGTGVTLHNRGYGFRLDDGHPNALAPGKRPLHTLIPGMAERDGRPWLAFGTRGADGQPQTGLQLLSAMLDAGMELQAAIEAPRWAHGAPGERFPRTALVLESRFRDRVFTDLAERGHEVMRADAVDPVMGTAQMIEVDPRGFLKAATDPRGDGVALAF
jgi:gamma-glutamyltranspeptidase/glutathione hydrolase